MKFLLLLLTLATIPLEAFTITIKNKTNFDVPMLFIGNRGANTEGLAPAKMTVRVEVYEPIIEVHCWDLVYQGHGYGDGTYVITEDPISAIKVKVIKD